MVTFVVPATMVFGALVNDALPPQDPQQLTAANIGLSGSFTYTIEAGTATAGPSATCSAQATGATHPQCGGPESVLG